VASNNTILLRGDQHRWHEEKYANDASVKPGYMIELRSDDKVQAHSTRGGKTQRWFAKEDYIRGGVREGTLQDGSSYYAAGDLVLIHRAQPGDLMNAVLKVGENVSEGDWAISYGDGTVAKAASVNLANNLADSATVTNTTAETTFSNGSVAVPANTLKAGDKLRITGLIVFPATNSTDTAAVNVKFGGATVLAIPALDVANNDAFYFDVTITVRTAGAAGTMVAVSRYSQGALGTATMRTQAMASTALDTTAAQTASVTVTWSVANAGNQAILRVWNVEKVPAAVGAAGGTEATGDIVGMFAEAKDLSAAAANDFVALEIGF
jgi:hypothetical protein